MAPVRLSLMQMNFFGEVIAQLVWLGGGVWFIHNGYKLNRKAKPFSLRDKSSYPHPIRDSYVAGGIVSGAGLLILLAYKLFTCGMTCWS
jgi:hypothetical protein